MQMEEALIRTTEANKHRIMNVGSPYNVPAGSQVQMDKVIEKYKKLANEDNERKLEKLRNNQSQVLQGNPWLIQILSAT